MKIRVFVPLNEQYKEHEVGSEVIPEVGAEFRFHDNAALGFAVERVIYLVEQGMIVPQVWLKETESQDIAGWISSWTDKL